MRLTRRLLTSQTIRPNPKPISTLFTSTGPIAHSKLPSNNASNIEFTNPKPGETPRQRVARLREAAYRAKLQQIPWQDRVIVRGRRVADALHRYFVLFLLGSGAILFILLIVIRIDVSKFLKNKSKGYLKEQEEKRKAFLHLSLAAREAGTATEPQLQFLARYERVAAEEEKRLQRRSFFGRSVDSLFPGLMAKQRESEVLLQMDDELEKQWEAKQAKMRQEEAEALERKRLKAAEAESAKSSKTWSSWLGWR